jgi:hypothetical protein
VLGPCPPPSLSPRAAAAPAALQPRPTPDGPAWPLHLALRQFLAEAGDRIRCRQPRTAFAPAAGDSAPWPRAASSIHGRQPPRHGPRGLRSVWYRNADLEEEDVSAWGRRGKEQSRVGRGVRVKGGRTQEWWAPGDRRRQKDDPVIVLAFRFYLPSLSAVGEQRRGSHEEERQTDEAIVSRKKISIFHSF